MKVEIFYSVFDLALGFERRACGAKCPEFLLQKFFPNCKPSFGDSSNRFSSLSSRRDFFWNGFCFNGGLILWS